MRLLVKIFSVILFSLLLGLHFGASAQEPEGAQGDDSGKNVGLEFGGSLGKLLPNQITGMSEIIGLGGVRAGYRLGPGGFVEGAFATGNGDGAEWKNFSLSARMDIPVETLVGTAFIGGDTTYYKGLDTGKRLIFGGHVGGGVMALIGGITWFRANMTFTVSPGTSLYIDFGFVFRLPGGGAGGGA